ncbi:DUF3224 domain-containing protein [Pseudoalteromonas sp. OOF1S-7]|uniref:DUF3224 domain-containing protein n=1 Tax=Pseudoalteromonas sp. OOF1S-7 TaxID=2917757 RepID=UPI001EF3E0A2|nr:DUF3224 domain-containing protein [Pseudoalteromonas sp. OOF1S-7]MCG7537555.1 DUF3224 domain-containing protein [Pseudoalteromonas sp. OOF1S-7]
MQKILFISFALMLVFSLPAKAEDKQFIKGNSMKAEGSFEVKLDPAKDEVAPAGRMLINKTYDGDVIGTGVGQMLSKRTESGVAVYSAIEEFVGSIEGKSGSFTLSHYGFMSKETQELKIEIVPGSGAGELASISGSLQIIQSEGKHSYILTYSL